MRWRTITNWSKTLIVLGICLLVMAIPTTRQILLWILPLGSGMDDLVFFILLFLFGVVALMKLSDVETMIKKLKIWFSK